MSISAGQPAERPLWTIATRNPRANRFLRVDDFAGTWAEAYDLGDRVAKAHPELQVYCTTTMAAEDAGYTAPEDRGNLMMDSSKRIRVVEGGKLADLLPEPTALPEQNSVTVPVKPKLPCTHRCTRGSHCGGCGCEGCGYSRSEPTTEDIADAAKAAAEWAAAMQDRPGSRLTAIEAVGAVLVSLMRFRSPLVMTTADRSHFGMLVARELHTIRRSEYETARQTVAIVTDVR